MLRSGKEASRPKSIPAIFRCEIWKQIQGASIEEPNNHFITFLLLPGIEWVEVEPAAMEKYHHPVFFEAAESSSIGLDELDLGIHPLGDGIGNPCLQ